MEFESLGAVKSNFFALHFILASDIAVLTCYDLEKERERERDRERQTQRERERERESKVVGEYRKVFYVCNFSFFISVTCHQLFVTDTKHTK